MSDQKVVNTLWIVVPALMAVVISARGGAVEVVRQGLPAPPVALATDRRPASADGFFWQVPSSPGERLFRSRDDRTVRLAVSPDETILWSRQVGDAVYTLAGHGPDRSGPPCVIDPPFVLRRVPVKGGPAR